MTRAPDGWEGFGGGEYLDVTDKLKECHYFLNLMQRTTDWDHFRWLTSAFLNAARATLDWFAMSAFYAVPGDRPTEMEPDERAIAILSKYLILNQEKRSGKVYASPRDPLLKELCDHRTVTAHEGPLWIKPEQATEARQFRFLLGDTPVLQFVGDVLALLVRIQRELRPDLPHDCGV